MLETHYFAMIRLSDFQKRHARRLFSAFRAVLKLKLTFECEHYVPWSAFEEKIILMRMKAQSTNN